RQVAEPEVPIRLSSDGVSDGSEDTEQTQAQKKGDCAPFNTKSDEQQRDTAEQTEEGENDDGAPHLHARDQAGLNSAGGSFARCVIGSMNGITVVIGEVGEYL